LPQIDEGETTPILAGSRVGGLASRRFQDMIAGRDVAASSRGE
jgi:hypothetical protein